MSEDEHRCLGFGCECRDEDRPAESNARAIAEAQERIEEDGGPGACEVDYILDSAGVGMDVRGLAADLMRARDALRAEVERLTADLESERDRYRMTVDMLNQAAMGHVADLEAERAAHAETKRLLDNMREVHDLAERRLTRATNSRDRWRTRALKAEAMAEALTAERDALEEERDGLTLRLGAKVAREVRKRREQNTPAKRQIGQEMASTRSNRRERDTRKQPRKRGGKVKR